MNKEKKLILMTCFIIMVCIAIILPGKELEIPLYFLDYTQPTNIHFSLNDTVQNPEDFVILHSPEDLSLLQQSSKTLKSPIKVIDALATNPSLDLATTLDLIDYFYYEFLRTTPYIEAISVPPLAPDIDSKIKDKYATLETLPLGHYIKASSSKQLIQPQYTVTTPVYLAEGQYVEYKVNGHHVGYSSRYPYTLHLSEDVFHPGTNQIKAIIHLPDHTYKTQITYVNADVNPIYPTRSNRSVVTSEDNLSFMNHVPILMYHKFLDQVGPDEQSIAVSTQLFEEQLKALLESGYTPIDFNDLNDYMYSNKTLPQKPVMITSDDGYLCNYTNAYPLLKKYQVKATFFVSPFYMGNTTVYDHFTWEQAQEMEQSGLIDIQSHTYEHTAVNKLTQVEASYQIAASFDAIEQHLGKRDVKVLAYPEFRHSKRTQKWIQNLGIDFQLTNLVKSKRYQSQPIDMKRIHVSNETHPEILLEELEKIFE